MRQNTFRRQLTTEHSEHHRNTYIQHNTRQSRVQSLQDKGLFQLVDVKSNRFAESFYLNKQFKKDS